MAGILKKKPLKEENHTEERRQAVKFVIEHLSKRYEKKEVLRDVDFSFESGRIYGLLGRNGAGKTTLFTVSTGCSGRWRPVLSVGG